MKSDRLVRFLISERSFPIRTSLLLWLLLFVVRAFGIDTGLSANGATLFSRAFSFALIMGCSTALVGIVYQESSLYHRRWMQLLLSLYFGFCTLNFFWLGADWRWTSFLNISIDLVIFWTINFGLDSLLRRRTIVTQIGPEPLFFQDELQRTSLSLKAEDLRYCKSEGNYVEFHYADEGRLSQKLLRQRLKKVLEFAPEELIQIHRSYLVAEQAILEFHRHSKDAYVILKGDIKLKVGKSYVDHLEKWNTASHSSHSLPLGTK